MSLNRQDILAATLRVEPVDVPEWGGQLHVRVMTGTERDAFVAKRTETKDEGDSKACARFIIGCACDEKGSLIFTEKDVEALANKSAAALSRVFKRVLAVNGIGPEGQESVEKN